MTTITVFPSLSGFEANQYETTFDGLVQWLNTLPEYPDKSACTLISLNRFGESRTEKGSLRSDANILAATGAIGDYDAGGMSPAEAAAILNSVGVRAIIVTTPSHGVKGHRWRLLLPFETERDLATRYSLLARVNTFLGGVLAGESFTASQAFYIGKVHGVEYQVIETTGHLVDVFPGIDAIPETGRPMAQPRQPGGVDEFALLTKLASGGVAQIRAALSLIPNTGLDWEYWNNIGMAVFNASGGSDEGLEVWREWSDQCPGSGDSVDDRWAHYQTSRPTEAGMGGLVYLAGGYAAVAAAMPPSGQIADELGAPKLRASSDSQRAYAENIRAEKLAQCGEDKDLALKLAQGGTTAKFWLDNRERTPEELSAILTPVEAVTNPFSTSPEPEILGGYQYLTANLQIEHFKGCVYVQSMHRMFTPSGVFLKPEQFNATYGGYVFQMDDGRDKTSTKAWEAFTESQLVRFPKVEATCFRPDMPPGGILEFEGRKMVNTYVPVPTERKKGNPAPFLTHLEKLLPIKTDRDILLAYMAACVQYPGVKFQWAPLIQGTEGNGKTLFTRCVAAAIGERYTHLPPASEIGEKFNEWLFYKLFIGIEDVYVAEHKREVIEILKPMITNDRLAMRAMQASQVMGDNRANFILNSNHKDAIRKNKSDRRFAVFYTAQQSIDDVIRDGMGGDYFPKLYDWLRAEGYAVVSDYLASYDIPDELNPATSCHRAPETSSTKEAVTASLGSIEQEILEAVEEGRPGFAGGWISSFALDRMLQSQRMTRAIPPNKRRELLQSIGYDWHPGLNNGRVNNPTVFDAGKPRLFIKNGHIHANLMKPAEVVKKYDEAQSSGAGGGITQAESTFS